jgi:hypothetical protein
LAEIMDAVLDHDPSRLFGKLVTKIRRQPWCRAPPPTHQLTRAMR